MGHGANIHSAADGATTREHSEPSASEATVPELTDVSSPKLLLESVGGVLNHNVTIKFTTTTKGKVETYLTFEFEDAGVSGFVLSSGGEAPMESLIEDPRFEHDRPDPGAIRAARYRARNRQT